MNTGGASLRTATLLGKRKRIFGKVDNAGNADSIDLEIVPGETPKSEPRASKLRPYRSNMRVTNKRLTIQTVPKGQSAELASFRWNPRAFGLLKDFLEICIHPDHIRFPPKMASVRRTKVP